MEIKKFKKLASTNIKAKELIEEGALPWTVVVSQEQDCGYGRKGEKWISPKGGLYFSVILPKNNIDDLQLLTILTAFVIAKIIKEEFNIEPLIKLPNDILLNGKKICGILTENVIGKDVKSSVMGVGLNTNTESFPGLESIATSLSKEIGREVDNDKILEKIIEEIKKQLETISK
ncbi:MAG: biotin--[acetyl-CoA-carboxylase] ligase [Candidatus Paceibacterota bacterium]|jgi:BirA family biotin operon repressor/biotin-[acetyl-CoA-carboxylase] ligase